MTEKTGLRVSANDTHTLLAPSVAPALTIEPGDTVVVETIDAFGGQIKVPGDRRDRVAMPSSNFVSGPIAVSGASPGDALRIEVLDIIPAEGQAATYLWPYDHVASALGPEHEDQTRVCPISEGQIAWSERLHLPYRPMIGVIATAPAAAGFTSEDTTRTGGNLDLRELGPGAEIWLPVERPGGLLVVGDCHASQGDGEIGGAALEMAGEVTLRIHLVRGHSLEGPRVVTPDELIAVASGLPLQDSVATAYGRLACWLAADLGYNRFEAYLLLTQVGRVTLGYIGLGVAGAAIPRHYVEAMRRT